jgi:hypothetical protein
MRDIQTEYFYRHRFKFTGESKIYLLKAKGAIYKRGRDSSTMWGYINVHIQVGVLLTITLVNSYRHSLNRFTGIIDILLEA